MENTARAVLLPLAFALTFALLTAVSVQSVPFNFDTDDAIDYSHANEHRAATHKVTEDRPSQLKPSAANEKETGNTLVKADVHRHGDQSENTEHLKLILMRWLQQSHDLGLIDFKTYLYDVLSLEQLDLTNLRHELNGWANERSHDNRVDLPQAVISNADASRDHLKSITKLSGLDLSKEGLGKELESEEGGNTNGTPRKPPAKAKSNHEKENKGEVGRKNNLLEAKKLLNSLSKFSTEKSSINEDEKERELDEEDESYLLSSNWSRKREELNEANLRREALLDWLDLPRDMEEEK